MLANMSKPTYQSDGASQMFSGLKSELVLQKEESSVLIVYTGGTIGMVRSDDGYVPAKSVFEDNLRKNPRFHDEQEHLRRRIDKNYFPDNFITPVSIYGKRVIYSLIEMDPLLDSSCMTKENWISIAEMIERYYYFYDGFVILHGTDTMAYTASMLSFMLENLAKPVILTGSQIPFKETRNDAVDNLLGAVTVAGHFEIPEVSLFFNHKLYRGNRCTKFDNSSFKSFDSPNLRYLVKLGIRIEVNWDIVWNSPPGKKFTVQKALDGNISILPFFPCMTIQTVESALSPPTKACIVQTYGAGNIPDNREDILNSFIEARKRGLIIVNITQCSKGGISDSYKSGKLLGRSGVISGGDMTLECAVCKLTYLLGKYPDDPERVQKLFERNLRGEVTIKKHETRFSFTKDGVIESIGRSLGLHTQEELKHVSERFLPLIACIAAKDGSVEILETLYKQGVNLNNYDYGGRTPLHVACSAGNLEVVKLLVAVRVSLSPADSKGNSPLFEAMKNNHKEICEVLVSLGAEVKANHEEFITTLLYAVEYGDIDKVKFLQRVNANLGVLDYSGRSILHIAAMYNQCEILKFLKENSDLNFELKDINGVTPLKQAELLQNQEASEFLSSL